MATDASNRINYYLVIDRENTDDLGRVRHWTNLKVAYEDHRLWVKDLDYAQINSVEVKSLRSKSLYYEKDGRLFPLNSVLPECIAPALLWTPIDRALKITLPSLNHNFFGLNEGIPLRMISSDQEFEPHAMVVSIALLGNYVETAPAIRLSAIRWVVLNNSEALLIGKPFLPLPGQAYWLRKDMLIPAGYDFEFHILSDVFQKIINPARDRWIVWNTEASYYSIVKEDFQTLSRSSFRLTDLNVQNGVRG
jgi:hypothetical protein